MATRSASTSGKPAQQRFTARTILLTLTGSLPPLRFFTRIVVCGYDAESMSDCEGANGDRTFDEETDGLNIVLTPHATSGTHPLQSRQTLEKRHCDRTERLTQFTNGSPRPPPARRSRSPTPHDSRRWVLAGLRAYEPSGRTRVPTAHCFPAS